MARGLERGVIGAGVPGTGAALWVEVEEAAETEPTERAYELVREYRAVVANIWRGHRIIEYLAVRKLRADRGLSPTGGKGGGANVALVDPPGSSGPG